MFLLPWLALEVQLLVRRCSCDSFDWKHHLKPFEYDSAVQICFTKDEILN